MFGVISKCRKHNLSIDCTLDMFDKIVKSIMLYGCEIYGFSNTKLLEKLHLEFCKYLLHVNKSTPDYMIYGELGRYPILINVKVRMVTFWGRIIIDDGNKLSSKLYKLLYDTESAWVKCVKSILYECGMQYIWDSQNFPNIVWLRIHVQQTLIDQFKQKWFSDVFNSPKAANYRIFKNELRLEDYLIKLPSKMATVFCKFRLSNFKLPVEVGRWRGVNREDRICHLCNVGIGDEFHYLFNCTDAIISNSRKLFIRKQFYNRPNCLKFELLFNTKSMICLKNLCKFIIVIRDRVHSIHN